ncbi:MAG TPA: Ig-like domain-containing protein [Candidatus Gemmiger faecavium]|nr:Ig-like domain-containing protein [Candidatus Gemmiger faecavium]
MARRHKMCLLGLLAALVLMLCGCSASDVHLPEQVDLFQGDSFPLASAVEWDGETDAASAALLLTAAGDNGITITFESADPAVAVVDEQGIIYGAAAGETTVTVTCPAFGYSARVAVNVTEPLGGLYMESALDLQPGQTGSLNTMLPGGDLSSVQYTVDDPAVVSVSADGTVTALSEGIATITATAAGSSLTARCEVVVGTPVQGVQVSRPEAVLDAGQTMVLGARVWPDNGAEVTWYSSDPTVAEVSADGKVTALTPGTVQIVAEVSGKTAACTLTVTGSATPESATPETATAETAATPESATPETATAETAATPESATPESAATPETAVPEEPVSTPENAAPGEGETLPATPETAAMTPETAATPESATPESATPETATAETATPESTTPETSSPGAEQTAGESSDTSEDSGGGWLDWLGNALARLFGR